MNCKNCNANCCSKGNDREVVCSGYRPMTNADRIRHMTDDELADYLDTIHFQGILVGRKEIDPFRVDVFEWLKWLKEEA